MGAARGRGLPSFVLGPPGWPNAKSAGVGKGDPRALERRNIKAAPLVLSSLETAIEIYGGNPTKNLGLIYPSLPC